jgi:hypothetical protein
MDPTEKRGIAPFVIAGLIFFAGIAGFVVLLFVRLSSLDEGMKQVKVPGEQEIFLEKPGLYTVFHEYRSSIGNRIYSGPQGIPGLECHLTSKDSGKEISLAPSSMTSRYDYGGRSGVSVLEFTLEQPGNYVFRAGYPGGQAGNEAILTIEQGFVGGLFVTVFASIGILFGSITLSAVIVAWTLIKRSKSDKSKESVDLSPLSGKK